MHTSGVIVVPVEGALPECRDELNRIPGVEIGLEDPRSRRIVALLETETLTEQEELLRRLQSLRCVVMAELVCHHFGDDAKNEPPLGGSAPRD